MSLSVTRTSNSVPFAPSVARDVTTSNSPRTSASTLPRIRKMDRLPRRRNWLAAPMCTVLSCSAAASSMMIVMPTFTPVINSSAANSDSEGVAAMSAVPRMTLTSALVGLSFLRPLTTMCSMRARASVSICCADTLPGVVKDDDAAARSNPAAVARTCPIVTPGPRRPAPRLPAAPSRPSRT